MPLIQKTGRLGSLLPLRDLSSILPCLSGPRRALSGHLRSISSFACMPDCFPSVHGSLFPAFEFAKNRCHNRISVCGVQWGLFSVRKVRIIFGSFSGPRSEFRSCIDLPSCLYPACQLHLVTFFHHRPQEISRVGFFSGVGNSPVSAGYLVRVAFYRLLLLVLCRDLQPSRVVGEIP